MPVFAGIQHVPPVRRQAWRHVGGALQPRQRHTIAARDLLAIDHRRLDLGPGRRIAVGGIDQETSGRIDLATVDVMVRALRRQRPYATVQRYLAEADALIAV